MRGTGRLLSGNEIKGKQPNLPGGHHYDAKFMRNLITAESDVPKIKVVNIHYKTFDNNKGVSDISVFMLDSDNKTVKQTMLKERDGGKTNMALYAIGDSGKVLLNNDIDKSWSEIVSEYIPSNIAAYSFFFPSLLLFEGRAWTEGISGKKPIYGYLNGFETNPKLPYGAIPGPQPRTMEWSKYLKQFFDGTKELLGMPKIVQSEPEYKSGIEDQFESEKKEVRVEALDIPRVGEDLETKDSRSFESSRDREERKVKTVSVGTLGSRKMNFKLYVVE
jgi:hypothetical protein